MTITYKQNIKLVFKCIFGPKMRARKGIAISHDSCLVCWSGNFK